MDWTSYLQSSDGADLAATYDVVPFTGEGLLQAGAQTARCSISVPGIASRPLPCMLLLLLRSHGLFSDLPQACSCTSCRCPA